MGKKDISLRCEVALHCIAFEVGEGEVIEKKKRKRKKKKKKKKKNF